jgi:hypothetical protein
MLEGCSLVPVVEDGTINILENTEFKNYYRDLFGNPKILENKDYVNIYQFVFKCIKKKFYLESKNICAIQKLYENWLSSFCSVFLDTGAGFNHNEVLNIPLVKRGNHFEAVAALTPGCKGIRFDPFNVYACIIDNLQIITDNGDIEYTWTNGIEIDGLFFFDAVYPQIVIDFKEKTILKIKISGDIYRQNFDSIVFSRGKKILKKILEEYNSLLNSRSWRITKPLRKFTSFIRRHKV